MALKRFLTCALLSFVFFCFGLFIGLQSLSRASVKPSVELDVTSIVPTVKETVIGADVLTQGEFEEMILDEAYKEYGIDRDTFTKQ
jgi:hypothetical protein